MAKVLHASESGYFPFCVPDGTIDSGSFIAVSLEDAMSIFWKVKIMSFSAYAPESLGKGFEESLNSKIQRSLSSYELDPIPDERNLVCHPLFYWGYEAFDQDSDPEPDFLFAGYAGTGDIFKWDDMVQSGGSFYIPIDLYVGFGDNDNQTYTLNYPPYDEEYEDSTTITIFGHSVQANYYTAQGGLAPIQISITPLEYWPYA